MDNPIAKAHKILGMMTADELEWLYETSRAMNSIVEIGSYKGRSTYALCVGCRGKVYAVDPFMAGGYWPDTDSVKDTYPEFMENMKGFLNLIVARMTSEEAAVSDQIPPIVDMVFIDGDHEYEAVLKDLTLWAPRARRIVCGHDLNVPGVEQALAEYYGLDKIKPGAHVMWYVEK